PPTTIFSPSPPPPPPSPTLFPYTTLFRSEAAHRHVAQPEVAHDVQHRAQLALAAIDDHEVGHLVPWRRQLRLALQRRGLGRDRQDRKSTRLNSSHDQISYAVFCLKKKKK